MNIKLKPPCQVEYKGLRWSLRQVAPANIRMKRRGWKGLVAYLNGYGGTSLVEYGKLKAWGK